MQRRVSPTPIRWRLPVAGMAQAHLVSVAVVPQTPSQDIPQVHPAALTLQRTAIDVEDPGWVFARRVEGLPTSSESSQIARYSISRPS